MRARKLLLPVLAAAALAAAGCGDDDETTTAEQGADTGQSAELTAVEESLKEAISGVRDDEPELESVDCPADTDLSANPAEFTCELSGGGETGSVEVTLRGNSYDYTGSFATSSFGGSGDELVEPETTPEPETTTEQPSY